VGIIKFAVEVLCRIGPQCEYHTPIELKVFISGERQVYLMVAGYQHTHLPLIR